MVDGVRLRIGEQTRTLRFTQKAVDAAEAMCGGEDIWSLVLTKLSLRNLKRIAAAGFSDFTQGGKKVSPPQVDGWLEREPKKIPELKNAVTLAVHQHLHEIGQFSAEDLKAMGEAFASGASASAGTTDSESAVDTGSTSEPPKT